MVCERAREPRRDDPVAVFERHRQIQLRQRRWSTFLGGSLFLALLAASLAVGKVSPDALLKGLPDIARYVGDTVPPVSWETLGRDLGRWYWGLGRWLILLGDTIVVAFLGTLFGFAGAFLLCFPASRNLSRSATGYFIARRLLEVARTVPQLVYALIFVCAFGLGPFAGMLAVAVHSAGAMGKLFADVNENSDHGPCDGVAAAGGSWAQIIRYAVVPQVSPNFASYTLLRFEINVREASVLGLVGAGGIGEELYLAVRQFEYTDISAIILLIIATVAVIDLACEQLRHRLIGHDTLRMA